MRERESFVLRGVEPGANIAALCREFGISRKTGYKWLERYGAGGLAALEDRDRAPQLSPLKVSGDLVADIARIRQAHPSWGARKIAAILKYERPGEAVPAARTVHRVLVRSGFLQPGRFRRRRRKREVRGPPRVVFKQPNDLWTVDFKGWWLAVDKDRCEPLTIRDAHSRFVLRIEVLPSPKQERVRAIFEEVFRTYGLPKAILSDNGPPFVATNGDLGLTKLACWWLSLGIELHRTRPATPSDNGGHERLHRDIAEELEAFASRTRAEQQEACERWRHDFNCHRPHEALAMKRPADVYRRSSVGYDGKPTEYVYPRGFLPRRVSKRGSISHLGRVAFISWALVTEEIGLEEVGTKLFDVWYRDQRLGRLDFHREPASIEALKWTNQAVVLPLTA